MQSEFAFPTEALVYICRVCATAYDTEEELTEHEKGHSKEQRARMCPICSAVTTKPEVLLKHKEVC